MAQSAAVGCSAGAARIVLSALVPDLRQRSKRLLGLTNFRITGSEMSSNEPCQVLKANGGGCRSNYFLISPNDFSLKRFCCDFSQAEVERNADMKRLFENTNLMEMMMRAKGFDSPTSPYFGDLSMEADYHFYEMTFDEEFEMPSIDF